MKALVASTRVCWVWAITLCFTLVASTGARADDSAAQRAAMDAMDAPLVPGEYAVRFTVVTVEDPQHGCLGARRKGAFKLHVVKTVGGYAVAVIGRRLPQGSMVLRYEPPISAHYEFGSYEGLDAVDGRTLAVTPRDPGGRSIYGTLTTGEACRRIFQFTGTWKRKLRRVPAGFLSNDDVRVMTPADTAAALSVAPPPLPADTKVVDYTGSLDDGAGLNWQLGAGMYTVTLTATGDGAVVRWRNAGGVKCDEPRSQTRSFVGTCISTSPFALEVKNPGTWGSAVTVRVEVSKSNVFTP